VILLPLPKSLTAAFLVVAPKTTWRSSPTVAVSELAVEEVTAADPRVMAVAELLCCATCSPELEPLLPLLESSSHLLVSCTSPPGWPLTHLWAGASAATALASSLGGTPIDADTARPLPPVRLLPRSPQPIARPEPSRTIPSRSSVPASFEDLGVASWLRVSSGFDAGGVQLTTRGMTRLGLPELRVFAVPDHHVSTWTTTIHGLAHVLLTRQLTAIATHPTRGSHLLPSELAITAADITAAEGLTPAVEHGGEAGDVGEGRTWWREVGVRYEVLRGGAQFLNVWALDEGD
jgi:hypothetical protein